jgi:hypothetical protein
MLLDAIEHTSSFMLQVSAFVWKNWGIRKQLIYLYRVHLQFIWSLFHVGAEQLFKTGLVLPERQAAELAGHTNWFGNRYDLMDLAERTVVRSLSACLGSIFISVIICVLCLNLLTPWSWVLLAKLTVFQLIQKFPAFYGTRRFITAFISARHLSLSWANSIQSVPHIPRHENPS